MKKKLFSLLLAVAACLGTVWASDTEVDGIWYDFDESNKTATVTYRGSSYDSYNNEYSGSVVIPPSVTYNGTTYSVTSIGYCAFYVCFSLTSITIPNSVTSIGNYAFYVCSSLTSVTIGNSVTSIGNQAFYVCSSLTSITIPNSVTSIGSSAFSGCSSLTSITIPNSVTSIGNYAFSGCSSLNLINVDINNPNYCSIDGVLFDKDKTTLVEYPRGKQGVYTIPNSVTSIKDWAFKGCSSLTSVTIPNSVTSIGFDAFAGCSSLTSINVDSNNPNYTSVDGVLFNKDKTTLIQYPGGKQGAYTIPNSVTSIGSSAFYNCSSLTSITIPNSVTSIGDYAFSDCSSLTSVTIPNSVTSIGDYAFSECSSLTSITIPNSVTSIGENAFWGCSSLTSITIPNSVTSIGPGAFQYCRSLTSITIPNSVTSIGDFAFFNCSSLTSVTIGNSVTSIGSRAFEYCSSLTSVTIEAETPPTSGNSVFTSTNNCPIYVPCGTLDAYKTAWSANASRIKYAPYSSYTINKKAENGHITTSSTDIFTICDTEHPVICTANPDRGCYFVRWADGNTENPRTIELTQDTTMEAIFDYLLTGKCGKDSALTWTLDTTTMALNITGSGALSENYTYGTFIESLTIGNEVTTIGEDAFYKCTNLKNVIIGSAVKVLEERAFAYCSSIETITCYSMRPPTVNQDALYGLDYSTIVYVPADYLNTYKMHDAWGLYDVRPLGATSAETEDVKITPSENEANVTWPSVSGAASYELVIKDKDGNIVCTLIFNANGQLTSIAFNAPSRNGVPAQTQSAGFSFTITGLDSGTGYDLTLTAKDNSGNVIEETTIPFQTDYPEGIEDISSSSLQGGDRGRLVLRDGQVLILRNGKTYTMQGQEVK